MTTEAAAIANLATPDIFHASDDNGDSILAVWVGPNGTVHREHLEEHRDQPGAARGSVEVHTPDGLVAYAGRHAHPAATTVWGDVAGGIITVVLNDHGPSGDGLISKGPGWADHRATLRLKPSPEWDAWTRFDGQELEQTQLASFLEERIGDVTAPDGSTMIEVTRNFHATSDVRFRSAQLTHSGEVHLTYEEEVNATAGQIDIPREFTLALRPFVGTAPREVRALFRYRVRSGKLTLGFRLLNLDEIRRAVVETVLTSVASLIGAPAIEGVAPSPRR